MKDIEVTVERASCLPPITKVTLSMTREQAVYLKWLVENINSPGAQIYFMWSELLRIHPTAERSAMKMVVTAVYHALNNVDLE